jgi:hypothetical protein
MAKIASNLHVKERAIEAPSNQLTGSEFVPEANGEVEYYMIEQGGSRFPKLETAERCLANWKKLKA